MLSITNLTVLVNGIAVLQNVLITIPVGTMSVLMGPNGSGKSSLAYVLAGHPRYVVSSGSIFFNGDNIFSMTPDDRARAGILLLPQYPVAIPGVTVRTFLLEAYRALVNAQVTVQEFCLLLQTVFATVELADDFADRGLYDGFSGGEKKRLELAQGLLFNPKLFILDEIDSGLDVGGLRLVKKVIEDMRIRNPNLIVLVITHYPSMVYDLQPDNVMVMIQGAIVSQGDIGVVADINTAGYDHYVSR